jgi:hypothetical protein
MSSDEAADEELDSLPGLSAGVWLLVSAGVTEGLVLTCPLFWSSF